MIKVVTTKGIEIKEFKTYGGFFSWLVSSNYGAVDLNVDKCKRHGGIVVVEPINDEYMGELHIKED